MHIMDGYYIFIASINHIYMIYYRNEHVIVEAGKCAQRRPSRAGGITA